MVKRGNMTIGNEQYYDSDKHRERLFIIQDEIGPVMTDKLGREGWANIERRLTQSFETETAARDIEIERLRKVVRNLIETISKLASNSY